MNIFMVASNSSSAPLCKSAKPCPFPRTFLFGITTFSLSNYSPLCLVIYKRVVPKYSRFSPGRRCDVTSVTSSLDFVSLSTWLSCSYNVGGVFPKSPFVTILFSPITGCPQAQVILPHTPHNAKRPEFKSNSSPSLAPSRPTNKRSACRITGTNAILQASSSKPRPLRFSSTGPFIRPHLLLIQDSIEYHSPLTCMIRSEVKSRG